MKNSLLTIVAVILVIFLSAPPAFAQAAPAQDQWSGSMQCQLDIQQPGYTRHEIQSWTLTGAPPTAAGGTGVPVYAATWSYTGQGTLQRAEGTRTTVAQWAINTIPTDAPFSISVRDGVLQIRRASAQQKRYGGLTGQRQVAVNGVPQQPTPITAPTLWEWALPWIEAAPGSNVSGTLSVRTEGAGGEVQQPGPPPFATCKYQFTRGNNLTAVSQSCPAATNIAQAFENMKANLARDFDTLLQQTQDPARRAALLAQKQRLLREVDSLKQQNLGPNAAACQAPGTTNVAQGGNSTTTGGNQSQNPPASGGTSGTPPAQSSGGSDSTTNAGNSQQGGASSNAPRLPPPQLVSITPNSVDQGSSNAQVTLVAQGTNWQMGTTKVDFGAGITPLAGPFVTKPGEAYVVVAVAPNAAPGPRRVSVTTNNESVSMPSAFTVIAKSASGLAPGPTSPVNALGGGAKTVYEGGNPTFTAIPTALPPTQTASVTPVQVTTTEAPAGTNTSTSTSGIPPAKGGLNKGAKTFTMVPTGTPAQSTNQPPSSGKYLVTMTGLWCSTPTKDDPLSFDGQGDEIYAAAFVRRFDRGGHIQEFTSRQTMIYGDSNKAPDRIQAGTQTQLGGIRRYDSIPNNITADRRFDPQDQTSQFPYKLWGGTLTDGADALLISPSIWESDNKPDYFYQWNQKQNSTINNVFLDTKVMDQINGKRFGTITLGATESVTGIAQQGGTNAVVGAAFGLIGLPPILFFVGGGDRPIGLMESGTDQNVLPNTAVVLTREVIETALSSPYNTLVSAAPGVNVQIVKPGIMLVPFVDSSRNISGNVTLEGDSRAVYVMAIQVERCEGNLLQYCRD